MLWFSVGRKDDFDNTDASDTVDANATRFAPNIGLNVATSKSVVKQFDKGYYDLYASFDMYQQHSSGHDGRLLAFVDSTDTIVASLKTVNNNNFNYGVILEINGKVLDVSYGFAIQVMSINQIEMHITCNGANSAVQVYLNGDLVVNYSGSITSNKLTAMRFEANYADAYIASNFIITDEGRIGKKYPILLQLTSIGAKNDASYYIFVGNVNDNFGATVYMNLANVHVVVNSILALKLSIKALASINLKNGEWIMNIAGKEISTPLPLSSTINQKDVLLEGTWLKSDIDSSDMKITGCQVSNLYIQALVTLDPCEWMNNKTTTIAYCYRICRTDGKVLGFTSHDQDITFDGTTYKANTGFTPTTVDTSNEMSSDNLDATMPLTSDEITVEDLENGLYDFAEFIVYSVNWKDISDDKLILRRGTLGRVTYKDRDFTTECRGLMEAYQYQAGDTYQKTCRNVFGDEKCGISLSDKTFTGKVVSVGESTFVSDLKQSEGYLDYGVIKWTSGLNAGRGSEVKHNLSDGTITLFLPPGFKPTAGDTFSVTAGCDRNYSTCCSKYSNWKCFRGEPFVPGSDYVIAYSGQNKSNVVSEGQNPKLG